MMLLDLLEFMTLGTTGLAAVLVTANSLDQIFEWTNWITPATGVIVVVGIVTHGWRFGQESGHLGNAAPRIVVKKALKSVRREVKLCNRREATCLASLNGPVVDSTEFSRPAATSFEEKSSVSSWQTSHGAPMTTSPLTACSPSVESDEAAFVFSNEEQSVVQCLRDMEHDRADRGRSAYGRGVCPVPGNETHEPACSAVPHASSLFLCRALHVVITWRSSPSEVCSGVRPRLLHLCGLLKSSR
ncbi:hypothetical protein P3T76_006888 [Phytophthora citrophthora]|uniref:Uncharacterized protein n=1 Tax=Phytophthora citrophthora TaxID=4793 RepID=A0AAD9GNT5_9STRA|nr:hypothetical protein P3T76_006888 [Phytophthora citrophthora]